MKAMKEIPNIPLGLQMGLAHNSTAMQAFLRLDNEAQDKIIEKANKTENKRELQKIVDELSKIRFT